MKKKTDFTHVLLGAMAICLITGIIIGYVASYFDYKEVLDNKREQYSSLYQEMNDYRNKANSCNVEKDLVFSHTWLETMSDSQFPKCISECKNDEICENNCGWEFFFRIQSSIRERENIQ